MKEREEGAIMKLPRRGFLRLAAGAAALTAVSSISSAQTYPSRPIAINVAFAAGGPTDTVARILAERMRLSLGQPVIVENVTGAGGSIGVGRVSRASPDGYTLSLGGWNTHVVNGAIYTLQYDVLRDFEPIALLSSNPSIVVAKKAMPASDLKGLIDWLKSNPDKASVGICAGCPHHVFGVFFQNTTGTRFQLIPYRGSGPAMQDMVAGQIDLMFDSPINSLPHLRAGTIKAYAVTAKSRLLQAPDIPTVDEAGLPGFYGSNWFALWAPRGTPKEVIGKLNSAVVEAMADPIARQRIAEIGLEIFPRGQQTPEALAAFHRAEIEKWWPIIKTANIKGE
jgi:tripartite-type tricarboxylate transporter receptor subunit TctC